MRPGLTLLETMVALVILALVVVAGLELLAGSTRLSGQAESWAQAVVHAEEGLESALLAGVDRAAGAVGADSLPEGYHRRVEVRPWEEPGVARVDVTVTWSGGRFELSRLVEAP